LVAVCIAAHPDPRSSPDEIVGESETGGVDLTPKRLVQPISEGKEYETLKQMRIKAAATAARQADHAAHSNGHLVTRQQNAPPNAALSHVVKSVTEEANKEAVSELKKQEGKTSAPQRISKLTPNSQSNKAAEKAIADAITKATNSVDSELKTLKKHTVANTKEATAEVKVANTKEATAEAKMSTNIQHAIDQAITTNGTKIVNQQVKKASVPAPTVPPTASPEEVKLTKKMDAAVKAAVSNSSSEYA